MNTGRELIISIEDKREIAKRLNVTMQTVHHALNNKPHSDQSRRIRDIALKECECMGTRRREVKGLYPTEVYLIPRLCQTCNNHTSTANGDYCKLKDVFVRRKVKTCKSYNG